jgi:hydroquinone glucosyltransferase
MAATTTGASDTSPASTEWLSPPELMANLPSQQQVVLFASPGAGHLIPLVELARRLAMDHGFAVTLVMLTGMSDPANDAAVLSSLPSSVATAVLPAVSLDDLPPDVGFGTLMFELVRRSLPHLRALMECASRRGPVTALVCDFFGTAALPLAAELGAQGYVFFPNSFAMISIMRHIVEIHGDAAPGEYRDLPDPLPLPGGPLLRHADLPDGFRESEDPVYAYLVEEARRYGRADGFLVNSFEELEVAMADMFKRDAEDGAFPPVYPVGPFVRSSSGDEADESGCLEWLDRQPEGSVVYVSFGTGGALSVEQTAELAAGLEMSGHRFLWVVRMPSLDGNPCALGTIPGDKDDPLAWLPEGFVQRTSGRGLAVVAWAPQVRVLSHPATASFVSHCGWNSTLESVAAGVPMVAWPLYAEQKTNAAILTEVTGVALRPAARGHGQYGLVTREVIAAAVRELMEGEEGSAVRGRARELREASKRAWSPEGSSRRAMGEVAGKLKAALVNGNGSTA